MMLEGKIDGITVFDAVFFDRDKLFLIAFLDLIGKGKLRCDILCSDNQNVGRKRRDS